MSGHKLVCHQQKDAGTDREAQLTVSSDVCLEPEIRGALESKGLKINAGKTELWYVPKMTRH